MKSFITLFSLLFTLTLHAQVAWIDPTFAGQDDSVTVYFDATEGNQALAGVTVVYAHTGVITNLSNGSGDWRHVQGNWGTADPKVKMTFQGANIHTLSFKISDFYNLPAGETVEELAFVFRNTNGSVVGRESDGADIYVPIFPDTFSVVIQSPNNATLVDSASTINFKVLTSDTAAIDLLVDNAVVVSDPDTTKLNYQIPAAQLGSGTHWFKYEANHQNILYTDSVYVIVQPDVQVMDPPMGIVDGVNDLGNGEVILQMTAPGKDFVYAIGDFSNWQIDTDYLMHNTTDEEKWWIQLSNIDPNAQVRYQFYVGYEGIRVGDVYAEMQLDPWNDPYIPSSVYPNIPSYPPNTTNMVSVFQLNEDQYNWTTQNYQRPDKTKMVIYELLVRDFLETHSYEALVDSLDYLKNLGVNAVELMPVNEFEGNLSWGYNPAYFLAPDKYYGPKNKLKYLVDACHERGMAVIVDMVLNHSFGQNPQVMMYFDENAGQWGQPTADNPWFNQEAKHDFNVGYDYNHESAYTKAFSKRVMEHWIEEYKIDGYRFDLSKGFTQKNTLGNVAAWGQYDQSRIDIWKDYADYIYSKDPESILILEHFADNNEEKELSNYGFMLWGNAHYAYKEAQMGYNNGDFNAVSYQTRGWNDPHLVGYYTSHDEERLIYESLQYGNSGAGHNVKDLETALARFEGINVMLLAVPGPKMLWQFDELGYDYSINYCEDGSIDQGCRTGVKPIRWDYIANNSRKRVYNVVRAMNGLRNQYEVFHSENFTMRTGSLQKGIQIEGQEFDAVALANFGVSAADIDPHFTETGTWYEFFSGESITVSDVNAKLSLEPGGYALYTTKQLEAPDLDADISFSPISSVQTLHIEEDLFFVYPNPANDRITLQSDGVAQNEITFELYSMHGSQLMSKRIATRSAASGVQIDLPSSIQPGVFLYTIKSNGYSKSGKLSIVK